MSDSLLVLTARDVKSKPIPLGTAACPTRPFSVSRTSATGSLLYPPSWEAVNPWRTLKGFKSYVSRLEL